MTDENDYYVVLFQSVSQAMKAEKILKRAGISHKLIPVPRHISSDCGVCIRFMEDSKDSVPFHLTEGSVPFSSIRLLNDE